MAAFCPSVEHISRKDGSQGLQLPAGGAGERNRCERGETIERPFRCADFA
jgi:hypothetical protein